MSDERSFCTKHDIHPESERWRVVLEELTDPPDEDSHREPFKGQVCPVCFINLREKFRKARRDLRTESRASVRLRSENDRMRDIIDAVCDAVQSATGQDPRELEGVVFRRPAHATVPCGGYQAEDVGELKRILPNLISEAAHKGKETKQD